MDKEESNNGFAKRLAVIQKQKNQAEELNKRAQQNQNLSQEDKKLFADNYERITLTENLVKELATSSKNQILIKVKFKDKKSNMKVTR